MRSAPIPTLPLGLILGTTALVAIALTAGTAIAQTTTGNLSVTASIAEGCTVLGGSLEFGTYDPATTLDESGTFDLNCVASGSVLIALGLGLNAQGDIRRMLRDGGTEFLQYQLFQDSEGASPWGDNGTAGSSKVEPVGSGNNTISVYGRIPGPQPALPGLYEDTVLITVTPE